MQHHVLRSIATRLGGALAAAALLALPISASAQFTGHAIGFQYRLPDKLTVAYDFGTNVVTGGIEFPANPYFELDASAYRLSFRNSWIAGEIIPHPFTGVVVRDVNGTIPPIIGVQVLPGSVMWTGNFGYDPALIFDPARVSFDDNNVFVDMSGAWIDPDTRVELEVTFAATPEPATLALFGTGLISLGVVARRRRGTA
jgi:hypothetical protein